MWRHPSTHQLLSHAKKILSDCVCVVVGGGGDYRRHTWTQAVSGRLQKAHLASQHDKAVLRPQNPKTFWTFHARIIPITMKCSHYQNNCAPVSCSLFQKRNTDPIHSCIGWLLKHGKFWRIAAPVLHSLVYWQALRPACTFLNVHAAPRACKM